MLIGIDYSPVSVNRSGIGLLTIELTKALLKLDQTNTYRIYTDNADLAKQLPQSVFIAKPNGKAAGLRWMWKVAQDMHIHHVDLLISTTSLTFPLLANNVIQIVNDLVPLTYPQAFSFKQRLIYRLGLFITATRARSIFFISHTVQTEFNHRYPTKANQDFSLLGLNEFIHAQHQERSNLNLPAKYFCSVSTLEPRKNYEGMIRAFSIFSKNHPDYHYLISGGKGWMYESLFQLVQELGVADKVQFLGYTSDEQKYDLYKHAAGFLYVSHDEGFGLPNIEAYALGVPVLTSDLPVMHEVMQDKALFASPQDPVDIAHQMEQLLQVKSEVDAEFLSRFDWEKVAHVMISLY